MEKIHFAVQASSTSWSGGKDYCIKMLDGHPVIYWTLKKIIDNALNLAITIIAPEFDRGGSLDVLPGLLKNGEIKLFYGFDGSPLDRLIGAFRDLEDNNYIVRVDGLNFAFSYEKLSEMYRYAKDNRLDLLKFPDDFPIHFTFDIYRIGALRKVRKMLNREDEMIMYKVHPKYYMLQNPDHFFAKYYTYLPEYSAPELKKY